MQRRPTEPRYFASRGGYYVQINKVQRLLAVGPEDDLKVKDEAWKKFHALMAQNQAVLDGDNAPLYAILERYGQWLLVNRTNNTCLMKKKFLQSFSDRWGKVRVCDLKKYHVEEWL